jgi:hypothetical protein
MIAWGRDHDLASISVSALESHPDLPVLRAFGFVRRPEQTTVIAYADARAAHSAAVRSPGSWYMTVGDRDL